MTFGLYCIRDLKSNWAPPTMVSNDEVAKRWFRGRISNDVTMKFEPSDFDLVKVGEYEPETGVIIPLDHKCICNGKEFE